MSTSLQEFVDSGPPLQRQALQVLLFLSRRRRGAALLARLPLAEQAARSVLAMAHYDDPAVARGLGWDAAAVTARGGELRRVERRP